MALKFFRKEMHWKNEMECGRHEAEMENKRYTGSPVGPYFVGLIDLEFDTSEQLFIIRKDLRSSADRSTAFGLEN
ncbi:hypothetical protein T01_9922 [Trichinella spiralis]|uniref:Uncharacterized protein n=1 Tax=Trichinella spiralis TaxID=6334 RepID=A0A0V1AR14_TRISP|nr:hypothetical protein T01_9922 [Trichinella spiralis]